MAQDKAPAFQFYPGDFLSDEAVQLMGCEEIGAYILLLSNEWLQKSIPADIASLAKLCRVTKKKMQEIWPSLSAKFTSEGAPEGRLINPRLNLERERQAAFKERQSENGKNGGRPKKEKPNETQEKGLGFSGETQSEAKKSSSSLSSNTVAKATEPASPFDKAEAALSIVAKTLKWDPPTRTDITRNLKPDCPVQLLIETYGVQVAAEMFLWAHKHWTKKPTWASVYDQRNQIREQMTGDCGGKVPEFFNGEAPE